MDGKLQLGVTNHAVDQYRNRVEGDDLRNARPESQIVRILREGISQSVGPSGVGRIPLR